MSLTNYREKYRTKVSHSHRFFSSGGPGLNESSLIVNIRYFLENDLPQSRTPVVVLWITKDTQVEGSFPKDSTYLVKVVQIWSTS